MENVEIPIVVNGDEKFLPNNEDENIVELRKRTLIKNLIAISLSWVFLFIGFFSLSNLQSSLNPDQNLGTLSLSAVYGTLIVTGWFFPKLCVRLLGMKWTIIASQFTYLIYVCSNFYPTWFTLIPASILLGFGASSLWVAKNLYVSELSNRFKAESAQARETILNRNFSVFYGLFLSSQIWANLLSSLVLKPELDATNQYNSSNVNVSYCGKNGCPGNLNLPTLKKPNLTSVYTLCAILSLSVVISILINIIFLTNIKSRKAKDQASENGKKVSELKKMFLQMTNKLQILITPFSIWVGFVHAFVTADFTIYFVACLFGVHKVGFNAMFYGISLTIGCSLFGLIVKYIGRHVCVCIGAFFYFSVLTFLMIWSPNESEFYFLYAIAFTFGLAVAFWEPALNASIAIFFPSSLEEGYSLLIFWESVGFFMAYLISSYFCVQIKLYILFAIGAVSFLGYMLTKPLRKSTSL